MAYTTAAVRARVDWALAITNAPAGKARKKQIWWRRPRSSGTMASTTAGRSGAAARPSADGEVSTRSLDMAHRHFS